MPAQGKLAAIRFMAGSVHTAHEVLQGVARHQPQPYRMPMMYGIYRLGGWIELAFAVVLLVQGDLLWGVPHLIISAFILPIGYRISTVFGVRLPWVKNEA
jgi:hypothetical protein